MYKNTSGQHIQFYAFDSTTSAPKTGDAANITAYVSIDGGTVTVLADTSATELSATNAKGSYQFDVAQAESNGNTLFFSAKSTTANVVLYPVLIQTFPACFGIAGGAAGGPYIAGSNAATTDASYSCSGNFTILGTLGVAVDFNVTRDVNWGREWNVTADITWDGATGVSISSGGFFINEFLSVDVLTARTALNAPVNVNLGQGLGGQVTIGPITANNAANDIALGSAEDGRIAAAALAAIQGIGPKAVTIHTTDGSVALTGVFISVLDGSNVTVATGVTNGSGNLQVNLMASITYTINAYKNGYTSASSSQTTSAGNGPQTLATIVLTFNGVVPTPPSNPALCTIYGYIFDTSGLPAQGIVITATPSVNGAITSPIVITGGGLFSFNPVSATSDNTGFFTMDVVRTDQLTGGNVSYTLIASNDQFNRKDIRMIGITTLNCNTL